MALAATHRQVVYRLLPQTRSSWRRLERVLEDQRQLYNAALEERIDCYQPKGRTCLSFGFDVVQALLDCGITSLGQNNVGLLSLQTRLGK